MSTTHPTNPPTSLRTSAPRRIHPPAIALGALISLAALAGPMSCERQGGSQPAATPTSSQRGPADQIYTVKGQIVALPDPAKPASQLQIHHEEIPNFVGAQGTVVGMKEMTMPFPLAPGVSLEGLAVGDKVEFTFDVWLKPRMTYHLSKIAKLPPETELNFKAAPRPTPTP